MVNYGLIEYLQVTVAYQRYGTIQEVQKGCTGLVLHVIRFDRYLLILLGFLWELWLFQQQLCQSFIICPNIVESANKTLKNEQFQKWVKCHIFCSVLVISGDCWHILINCSYIAFYCLNWLTNSCEKNLDNTYSNFIFRFSMEFRRWHRFHNIIWDND